MYLYFRKYLSENATLKYIIVDTQTGSCTLPTRSNKKGERYSLLLVHAKPVGRFSLFKSCLTGHFDIIPLT